MSNKGTNEAEQSLNAPSTEEEFADAVLAAVSEGNDDELERLFTDKPSPDATSDDQDNGSDEDPESDEDAEEAEAEQNADDAGAEEQDSEPSPSKQEPSPAELRLAQLEKELNDIKATAGRVGFVQSRLAQLEAQLKRREEQAKAASKSDAESKLRERIAKLKEIDPETAEILELLAEQDKAKAEQANARESEEVDPAEVAYVRAEAEKVMAVHADALSIFKHPAWHLWKDTLTPEQRAWAESPHSYQVIEALNAFKAFRDASLKPVAQEAPAGSSAVQDESGVDPTQAARKSKLQKSAVGGDAPLKASPAFDADAFFHESLEKIAKEAGIA